MLSILYPVLFSNICRMPLFVQNVSSRNNSAQQVVAFELWLVLSFAILELVRLSSISVPVFQKWTVHTCCYCIEEAPVNAVWLITVILCLQWWCNRNHSERSEGVHRVSFKVSDTAICQTSRRFQKFIYIFLLQNVCHSNLFQGCFPRKDVWVKKDEDCVRNWGFYIWKIQSNTQHIYIKPWFCCSFRRDENNNSYSSSKHPGPFAVVYTCICFKMCKEMKRESKI